MMQWQRAVEAAAKAVETTLLRLAIAHPLTPATRGEPHEAQTIKEKPCKPQP